MQKILLLAFLQTLLISCQPGKMAISRISDPFLDEDTPVAPDYSREECWAALPDRKDEADEVPATCTTKDAQATAVADVFFIYPTIFTYKPTGKNKWNADIHDSVLNKKIDEGTIKYQASIFNAAGKIYSPRYRQAHLTAYYTRDSIVKEKSFSIAYTDVKAAFEYYLAHYNNGRPIIIASHSQGTTHAIKLLKDFFDSKPLSKQLVAAYMVGMDVKGSYYETLKPCEEPAATGCYISWRTYAADYFPKFYNIPDEYPVCTNPLTWRTDSVYADRTLNKGAVLRDFNKIIPQACDAQVKDAVLRINKPYIKGRFLLNIKNYHIVDYNLFYINIRENAVERVKAFEKR